MNKSSFLKVVCITVVCVVFGWAPESAFAQRGGHGGGGGFHGGGGGFHSSVGGFHGGGGRYAYGGARYGGYGYHVGYYGRYGLHYGWRGGYWGYPRYGYYGHGWGFGFGFGLGYYWPGYGFPYGYAGYPYSPYYAPYGYPYPYNGDSGGSDDAPPPVPAPKSPGNSPAKPSTTPLPEDSPDTEDVNGIVTASVQSAAHYTTGRPTARASHYQLVHSVQQVPPRREVQNAIRALSDMPPSAFQRRIDSGLYINFSPAERELVSKASQYPLNWEKP